MGNEKINSALTDFLSGHGVSLSAFGSSESGLNRDDAIAFLSLLWQAGKDPLGIEVWRRCGDDFSIDSLGGWYAQGKVLDEHVESAKKFIATLGISDVDLVTIQFD